MIVTFIIIVVMATGTYQEMDDDDEPSTKDNREFYEKVAGDFMSYLANSAVGAAQFG